jgi:threonine dehydratase
MPSSYKSKGTDKGMISLKDIKNAKKRIERYIRNSPLEYSNYYSEQSRAQVYIKFENLQLTGSFKIRGALNRMLSLSSEEKSRGIVTASAGNHAQGIGFGAKMIGIEKQVTIVVPESTPDTKIDAIRRYGVDLEIHGPIYDDAENYAIDLAKTSNKLYISPYNDSSVMAGQGTIALEILDSMPDVDIILVPVSGGGLLGGILIAAKAIKPSVEVYGVQSEACPVMAESLKQGKIVDVPMEDSIAEGLFGGVEKNSITFEPIKKFVKDILLVSEQEIRDAIRDLIAQHHQIAEGAGAVGLAAILRYKKQFKDKKVAVVVSGGNIDLKLIREILCE